MSSSLTLPAALIIMDGFGIAPASEGNAISLADTPFLDKALATQDVVLLDASGEAVGLPAGQMGNSEVGHLNIGAGRVIYQELSRINNACKSGELTEIALLQNCLTAVKEKNSVFHIMGLLSDGGVHSHIDHLFSLLKIAVKSGVPRICVHAFMDGRDVEPTSGVRYIRQLKECISELEREFSSTSIVIESISGRYYAMDRDKRWDRVHKAYDALCGMLPCSTIDAETLLLQSYEQGVTDEFIEPANLGGTGIHNNDALLFFNFRPDRAREISHAFIDEDFDGFEREKICLHDFICFTEYEDSLSDSVLFPKEFPENVLADVIADAGLKQLHIAETEKYAHVTFFLNGGREEEKPNEKRVLIPSPKVATYDLQPEMSAFEVADALVSAIENDAADFYIVNFANCDMVGHTGDIPAAIKAVETVDTCVANVLSVLEKKQGVALLTADHGNADKMLGENNAPHTAHTLAQVPCVLFDYANKGYRLKDSTGAALCDIAPTLLSMAGMKQPSEMSGKSLLD